MRLRGCLHHERLPRDFARPSIIWEWGILKRKKKLGGSLNKFQRRDQPTRHFGDNNISSTHRYSRDRIAAARVREEQAQTAQVIYIICGGSVESDLSEL